MSSVDLVQVAAENWERLEYLCGFGPFQKMLPDEVRRRAVTETIRAHQPNQWLASLQLISSPDAAQSGILRGAV